MVTSKILSSAPSFSREEASQNYEDLSVSDFVPKVTRVASQPVLNVGSEYQSIFLSNKAFCSNLTNHFSHLDINSLNFLGSGNFKNVYKTTLEMKEKEKSLAVAVQKPNLQEKECTAFATELDRVIEIGSHHIRGLLPLYGVLQEKKTHREMMISKLCAGDLGKEFADLDMATQNQVIKLAWDAVRSLHEAGYAHRDIKASNFLFYVSKKGKIKIYLSDFGLTIKSASSLRKLMTNLSILDPYSYRKCKDRDHFVADPKSDTWAFGLMICQLIRKSNKESTFDGDSREQIEHEFQNWTQNGAKANLIQSKKRVADFIERTSFLSRPGLKDLVKQMMAYDPNDRPSDEDIAKALST